MIALEAERVAWCDVAAAHLDMIEDQPAFVGPDFYRAQVEAERAELIGIFSRTADGRERVGSLVTRFEYGDRGKELVLMACGGCAPVNAVPNLFPVWEALARNAGCVSACFETSRTGLAKWAVRRGWRVDSVNLRITL